MSAPLTILGISSCDDTATAVVCGVAGTATITFQCYFLSNEAHANFGGVVPGICAVHAEKIDHAIEDALAVANVGLFAVDAIAVTAGPAIGGVLSTV
jgi:N6-L-threonylcarbamoyladenine synthase